MKVKEGGILKIWFELEIKTKYLMSWDPKIWNLYWLGGKD
jgi:hypothetical protein